jgi:carbon monoxide dehydrogenase subunit G
MKVTGTSTLSSDRATVWQALNDPAVLVRTIPGCRRLESVGEDAFAMTVSAGVGSIKGVYDGRVRLTDQQEPGSFRMHAEGSGAPGTIGADVRVTLEDTPDGGTALTYDADAVVGGMIGGVGQRMLTGVSKKMAAEFFRNVDATLAGGAPAAAAPEDTQDRRTVSEGQVFTAPAPIPRGGNDFTRGVLVGAVAALAGALVGAGIATRRHPH